MSPKFHGIAAFVATATMVPPSQKVTFCRNAKDNMLLECCIKAGADALVTGDRDLLDKKVLEAT